MSPNNILYSWGMIVSIILYGYSFTKLKIKLDYERRVFIDEVHRQSEKLTS